MSTVPGDDAVTASRPAPAAKPANKVATHKVRRGETLSAIVRRFDCDLRDLARANKLKAPKYTIRPGQSLKLESCKA